MAWISHEFKNMQEGDRMMCYRSGGFRQPDTCELGVVTRFTDSNFWVRIEGKMETRRYTRSWGREHGKDKFSNRAKPFDQESWDEHLADVKRRKAEAKQEAKDRADAELLSQMEWECDHIEDKKVQAVLRPFRDKVVGLRKQYIEPVINAGKSDETTVEEPWRLVHNLTRGDGDRFINAVYAADKCRYMHEQLVNLYDEFEAGKSFRFKSYKHEAILSKEAGTEPTYLMKAFIETQLAEQANKIVNSDHLEPYEKAALQHLLNCGDMRWGNIGGFRFNVVKDDD